jgi:hypothetical protein
LGDCSVQGKWFYQWIYTENQKKLIKEYTNPEEACYSKSANAKFISRKPTYSTNFSKSYIIEHSWTSNWRIFQNDSKQKKKQKT